MSQKHAITFDAETVPSVDPEVHARIAEEITCPGNITKPESIAAWEKEKKPALVHEAILKTSFDGALGSLCVIGAAINDEDPVTFYKPGTNPHDHEVEILKDFFHFIRQAYSPSRDRKPVFVGHNIVAFDLRFIFQRAVILGVQPPQIIPFHAKPWDDIIHDNMVAFAGARGSISQDKLARALGLAGKQGMDGSMVWPAVCEGRIDEVADYCADDVSQARAVWKRLTFQGINLSREVEGAAF